MANSNLDVDETHDINAISWVAGANDAETDFPVQNLPFGVYRKAGSDDAYRGCIAIGDCILDLAAVDAATGPVLNDLASAGPSSSKPLRHKLFALLTDETNKSRISKYLSLMTDVELGCPIDCPDYTDFYTSYYHAFNAGSLFRPDAPITPNFKWLPIAYHGRSSSIVVSGNDVRRPWGQRVLPGNPSPEFGPSVWLDYEVELGLVMGKGNEMGSRVSMEDSEDHIFGVVLLNDWSARDIQAFEYDPLGPFLGKNFATTISPWIVTTQALAPFRKPAFKRFEGDPECPSHLDSERNQAMGHFDIKVEAWTRPVDCKKEYRLSQTTYATSYWTPAQLVAHHTSGGCPLRPGDILGTGTISGPNPEEAGALLELTKAAQIPIQLTPDLQRTFIEDGDTITLRGHCTSREHRRIGFGEASGQVVAAL
jgi:fumarylacetoacetase